MFKSHEKDPLVDSYPLYLGLRLEDYLGLVVSSIRDPLTGLQADAIFCLEDVSDPP